MFVVMVIGGEFPGDVMQTTDNEWKDILVTKVLDGGMFWAQVGESCIQVNLRIVHR